MRLLARSASARSASMSARIVSVASRRCAVWAVASARSRVQLGLLRQPPRLQVLLVSHRGARRLELGPRGAHLERGEVRGIGLLGLAKREVGLAHLRLRRRNRCAGTEPRRQEQDEHETGR